MLEKVKQDSNITLNFGKTYSKIDVKEGILHFDDKQKQYRWIFGCDGLNSTVRGEMDKVQKLDFVRIDDDYCFIEIRVSCPPGVPPDLMHFMFGKTCHIILLPIAEGYAFNPV